MITASQIAEGLILYLSFIIALSFHEYAHAWVATRCGDETSKRLGRLTLNPLAHIDTLGTVILPMAMIFLPLAGSVGAAVSGFVIGWAKPVPINPQNFRNEKRDENLVSLAGPLSNLVLAFALIVLYCIVVGTLYQGSWHLFRPVSDVMEVLQQLAFINIALAWFNLIPIPPLDGSHLLKNLTRMKLSTYIWLSQWGIWILILALNFTPLQKVLSYLIVSTYALMGVPLGFLLSLLV